MKIYFKNYVEGTEHVGEFRKLGAGRLLQIQSANQATDEKSQLEAGMLMINTLKALAIDEVSRELVYDIPAELLTDFIQEVISGSTSIGAVGEIPAEASKQKGSTR